MNLDRPAPTSKVSPSRVLSLAEIYGPDHGMAPLACEGMRRWLPEDPPRIEGMTGGQVTILGPMGLLCNRGCVSPTFVALVEDAGLSIAADIHAYRSTESYAAAIASFAERYRRVVTNFTSPPGLLPADRYWIDGALQSFLNNKANIDRLVPAGRLPERSIVDTADLANTLRTMGGRLVAKAATDLGSGGGCDVLICSDEDGYREAEAMFGDEPRVVVERFIDMTRSFNLNFAVFSDGRISFLGAAEQICEPDGTYAGNWIDRDLPPPDDAVALGTEIAKAAAARGFYGICGFDIAVLPDGRCLAFDLNFRANGCTTQIMLEPVLQRRHPHRASRLWFTRFDGSLDDAARVVRDEFAAGWLIPVAGFDPRLAGLGAGPSRLQFLVLGDDRETVTARRAALLQRGLA